MRPPPLACTVRRCLLPLERRDRAFVCPSGHSYDVARAGYVNLLQPQDRRSVNAGDSAAAVEARAALLSAGVGGALISAVASHAAALELRRDGVVIDLGSGSGEALAAVAESRHVTGVGIDLSTAAAERAARRFPALTWIVANADRRLPLLDRSVDLVLSLYGRRNPVECARVLAEGGFLIVVLPAPDDVIELREIVLGQGLARERGDAMITEHQAFFSIVERSTVRETMELDRDALLSLLRGTYRGARVRAAGQALSLDRMTVTLSAEIFVMRRRPGSDLVGATVREST